jgi:transcriptional regulator with XRE-family HTH domain
MSQTPLVTEKLREYMAKHSPYGMKMICDRTGLGHVAINNLTHEKKAKYKPSTLNVLYDYFKLERDDWYRANMKKWHQKPDSILGSYFREKRIALGLSIPEVARALRNIDERTIHRIESGDSFPDYSSYTIIKLIEYYKIPENEKHTIMWHLRCGHDMMGIFKQLVDDIGKLGEDTSIAV